MLVVCQNKDLHGFTYGRLYLFIYDTDLTETGYTWVKNDKGVIVGERINYFKKLTDWKKSLENRNAILWALTSGVL